MKRSFLLGLALVASWCVGFVAAQGRAGGGGPPPAPPSPALTPLAPGTGAISGVVVDGATGTPVAGAVVYLSMPGRVTIGAQSRQLTDAKGRFAFVDLPAAAGFTLGASKLGYLDGGFGRESGPTDVLRPIALRDDEWFSTARVTLWRPGAISGTVLDERGEPVVGVYVRLLARFRLQGRDQLAAGPITTTDDHGTYRLSGLGPGRYVVQVPSVQSSVPVSVALAPQTVAPGGRTGGSEGVLDIDQTSRLVIGKYPLPPPPAAGRALVYPMAFHPAAIGIAQAGVIDLKVGEDKSGVNVTIEPAPAVTVSGLVEGPDNALQFLTLRLLPAGLENLGQGAEVATALVAADGRFVFVNVPPGAYTIDAPRTFAEFALTSAGRNSASFPIPPANRYGWSRSSQGIDSAPGLNFGVADYRSGAGMFSARAAVVVGTTDVSNVMVRMQPHATMTGQVVVESDPGQPTVPTPERFSFMLDPATAAASLGAPRSQSSPDGATTEFSIPGVQAGEYWLRLSGSVGWVIKTIQWKGRDYTDTPFDAAASPDLSGIVVTMTNAVPTLSGVVRQRDGAASSRASVIAFPVNRGAWANTGLWPPRLKSTPASSTGAYRLAGLPAGAYLVVALDGSRTDWRDPAFLALAESAATRVTLTWGGAMTQDLVIATLGGRGPRP